MTQSEKNKTLVLFDFDGTLTSKDSFICFLLYSEGILRFCLGMACVLPSLILYFLKVITNETAKQEVFRWFYRGRNYDEFKKKSDEFSLKKIPEILRESEEKKLMRHIKEEHEIVLVSASLEDYLSQWCESKGIGCIGTRTEVVDGRLTGKFLTKNCYGLEKVKRIKEKYNLEEYSFIYAYGDSRGDQEMLNLAHEKYYKGKKI